MLAMGPCGPPSEKAAPSGDMRGFFVVISLVSCGIPAGA